MVRSPDPGSLADTLARLERWLARHRPRYLASLRPGADAAALARLEYELGQPVPPDLRALLTWRNGQGQSFRGALVEAWNFRGTPEIPAAWRELDRPAWIPFLDDDAGNFVCLDTSTPEAPVREFWLGACDQPPVAASLAACLLDLVVALEQGDYTEDPERGHLHRRHGP